MYLRPSALLSEWTKEGEVGVLIGSGEADAVGWRWLRKADGCQRESEVETHREFDPFDSVQLFGRALFWTPVARREFPRWTNDSQGVHKTTDEVKLTLGSRYR